LRPASRDVAPETRVVFASGKSVINVKASGENAAAAEEQLSASVLIGLGR